MADPGREALQHMDQALAEHPNKNGHALSATLRCVAALREEFLLAHRGAANATTRKRLDQINGVISSVMAVQFPLGNVPWDELEKARAWLAEMVEGGDTPVSLRRSH